MSEIKKSIATVFTESTLVPLGSVISVMLVIAGGAVWLAEIYRDFTDVKASNEGLVEWRASMQDYISKLDTHMALQNERLREINERLEVMEYGSRKNWRKGN